MENHYDDKTAFPKVLIVRRTRGQTAWFDARKPGSQTSYKNYTRRNATDRHFLEMADRKRPAPEGRNRMAERPHHEASYPADEARKP